MSLISVRDLCVDFHTQEGVVNAVKNVSFEIPEGKTVGLVGESGSGKSVSSLAIMRLIPNPPGVIRSGSIEFQGRSLLDLSADEMRKVRGNDISMIFQEPMTSLNPVFKVGFQVSEVLRLHRGMNRKEAWEKSIELLDQVGIPNPSKRVHAYPHELSGGQKQRVMIAMAIGCNPKLLIADEPTTALDVTIQKQVLDLMAQLQDEYGMSILFITHDLGVIADIADEVLVMYRGDLVEHKSRDELFKNPEHPYTRGLLACRPKLENHPRRLLTVEDFVERGHSEISSSSEDERVIKEIPQNGEKPILEVKSLCKHFSLQKSWFSKEEAGVIKAVDDVSFSVHKGRTLGLVGESGCGKTTLGRSLLRLIEPSSGQILFNGQDVMALERSELRKLRRKMQIIFQDPYASLNPRMTIGSAIMEPMNIHGLGENRKERREKTEGLLERVGLEAKHFSRFPHEFSGGQRQRICIARALAVEPEFVICDESVSALDVSIQAHILNLLLDLQDELNLTYIFISHDLSVVKFFSDDVAVMYGGKILEMSTSQAVYESPQNDYTRTLLDAIPKGA